MPSFPRSHQLPVRRQFEPPVPPNRTHERSYWLHTLANAALLLKPRVAITPEDRSPARANVFALARQPANTHTAGMAHLLACVRPETPPRHDDLSRSPSPTARFSERKLFGEPRRDSVSARFGKMLRKAFIFPFPVGVIERIECACVHHERLYSSQLALR